MNPVDWYNSSTDAVGGWFDDSDAKTTEDTGTYPNVSSVPEKPTPPTTSAERAEIKDQLVADRANAQYDDTTPTPTVEDAGTTTTTPLAEVKPDTPPAPKATPAEEPLKPVRMTSTDEVTKQSETAAAESTTTTLPSQATAPATQSGSGTTASRSSLWPNAPVPDSEGDTPITSAKVGDPLQRPAKSESASTSSESTKSMEVDQQTTSTASSSASTGSTVIPSLETEADTPPVTPAAPAPQPAPQPKTVTPKAQAPAAEPKSAAPEIAAAPATEPAVATPAAAEPAAPDEPKLVTLTPPKNPAGDFNFNDNSVTVDESALPGGAPSQIGAGGQGGSYQAGVIRFAVGSSRLSSADQGVIRELVPLIREYNATVQIVGHSSSRTRNMDPSKHQLVNFQVSLERANAVAQALINAGAPSDRISVEAVADTQPVSSEAMPAGEAENRRVEIYLTY